MVSEINLLIVLPLCVLGFFSWVGLYIFMTLTVMRHDPREKEYREDTGKDMGLLPDKLFAHLRKGNK